MSTRFSLSLNRLVLAGVLWGCLFTTENFADSTNRYPNLAEQIRALAAERGLAVAGVGKIEDGPPMDLPAGDPVRQIKTLLVGYNYVLTDGSAVRKLIVLGKKRRLPPIPTSNILPTRRVGSHHLIDVTLVGNNSVEEDMEFMIDTGASFLVLPMSLTATLGFQGDEMREQEVQTAKGRVAAKVGVLRSVRLGTDEVSEVEAAFIEDELLGGHRLLGMNVLGRFRMTLDDEHNELTLAPR